MRWRRARPRPLVGWRRWADELDPWSPRPSDHLTLALLFLLFCLLYVGERNHAVQLNRDLFRLQERVATLECSTELLAASATELAGRERILNLARRNGMVVPPASAVRVIYFVPENSSRAPERLRLQTEIGSRGADE